MAKTARDVSRLVASFTAYALRQSSAVVWTMKDSPGVICVLFLPGVWVAATTVTLSSSCWPMVTRPFPVDPLPGLALTAWARQDRNHVRRHA